MPRSGRTVPEAGHQDAIREVIFQGYRIVYRIKNEDLLQIATVLHSIDASEALKDIGNE